MEPRWRERRRREGRAMEGRGASFRFTSALAQLPSRRPPHGDDRRCKVTLRYPLTLHYVPPSRPLAERTQIASGYRSEPGGWEGGRRRRSGFQSHPPIPRRVSGGTGVWPSHARAWILTAASLPTRPAFPKASLIHFPRFFCPNSSPPWPWRTSNPHHSTFLLGSFTGQSPDLHWSQLLTYILGHAKLAW